MDGSWTLEPSEETCAPAQVELTWTPERIERLTARKLRPGKRGPKSTN